MAPTGATTTQYSILRFFQREGESPLRRVADALELERTSLYRAIAPLERDGFVALRVDPDDGRVKLARLTRQGAARISEIRPYWEAAQESFLAAVGAAEWDAVSERLDGLRQDMAGRPEILGQLREAGADATAQ